MRYVVKLRMADFFELFAFGSELFVYFDHLFGHYLVRLLRAAHQNEIVPSGQPLVTIGIQPHSYHHSFAPSLRFARIRHYLKAKGQPTLRQYIR